MNQPNASKYIIYICTLYDMYSIKSCNAMQTHRTPVQPAMHL